LIWISVHVLFGAVCQLQNHHLLSPSHLPDLDFVLANDIVVFLTFSATIFLDFVMISKWGHQAHPFRNALHHPPAPAVMRTGHWH
jgi:hypothetical protein